ncbi:MAG TPA: DUF1552 domain-containing protein [Gammaproteobacteria bacterium]|nr:DUF1552 domain-containing protein [Gammaproteobacteria bacterium]
MFVTKKHLSRRTVLKAAGAAISLPLLDAMIPARTALAKTAANPLVKLGFIYFPHGAVMDKWTPSGDGKDFELGPILKPLEPFKNRLTIVSGLANPHAAGPTHAITPGTWLSSVSPRISHDPYGGITADQIAAQHIGQDTPLPSLEVATEEPVGGGACDRNYGCSYGATISFRTPSTPLPMEFNPRKLFQSLFGQGDTPEERKVLAAEYASILDAVSDKAVDLERRVGGADRAVLGDYLESVREIERRVQKMEARDLSHLKLPDAPVGIPNDFEEQMGLMFDIVALAWQAGLTRVTTFMMEAEVSNRTFNQIGVSDAFHALSHHQNNGAKLARLERVQTYNTQQFARFVKKLAETPDGEGSLLDHAILVFGSNMSNSNAHDHFPLPSAIIGGGCGKIKGGRHVRCKDESPVANLALTALLRAGVPVEKLGDSTGELSEI